MHPADTAAVLGYLGATLALGFWIGRRQRGGTDFFLAGRSLPWWAIGFSLVASDIGGTDIIGVGGAAHAHGLAVANFEWIGCVPAMILGAFVFVPLFWRAGVYTIPEFLERRFNAGVRVALATCWVIFMASNLGIMLFASAKMMQTLLGLDLAVGIALTAALVGFYTFFGGLKAVVYTDVLQCVVMIAGCLLVLAIGLVEVGGIGGLRDGLAALGESAEHHTELVVPADADSPFVWPAILFGLAMVLSPAYWIGNQAIMQRALGAKSAFQAQAGYIFGSLVKTLIPIIIAVPGLVALVLYPELAEDGDSAFPLLVDKLLPAGLRGLFFAAFIAALMSSVDSYLNSSATLVVNDFYRRFFRRDAWEGELLNAGRTATLVLLAWGVCFAWVVRWMDESGQASGIYAIFQTLMAFFQGPALAVILTGFFWPRATGAGALAGFLCGVAVSVFLFAANHWHAALGWKPLFQVPEPFLYFSVWAFLAALVVIVAVSLLTPAEPEKVFWKKTPGPAAGAPTSSPPPSA